MNYSKHTLSGYLIGGKWHEAIDYLQMFPGQQALARRIEKRTIDTIHRSDNTFINKIDAVFQQYYKMIFWDGASREEGVQFLFEDLIRFVDADELHNLFADTFGEDAEKQYADVSMRVNGIEELLKVTAEGEGYHYLGGDTQGYFGPYIWKSTIPVTYPVTLPAGTQDLTIDMMEGFVSRSWLDYISAGKIGTGGWAKNGELYCVKDAYAKKMDKPSFLVSYLKHEAQHGYDMAHFPGITTVQLEYRAKLVELIYYPNILKFKSFLSEASNADKSNSHTYASYLVIRDLSRRIFQQEYIADYSRWKGKLHQIQNTAMDCYYAFSI